jgi:hypothetical protein
MDSREEQVNVATSSRVTLDDLAMESPEGKSAEHAALEHVGNDHGEDELEETDDEGEHEACELSAFKSW